MAVFLVWQFSLFLFTAQATETLRGIKMHLQFLFNVRHWTAVSGQIYTVRRWSPSSRREAQRISGWTTQWRTEIYLTHTGIKPLLSYHLAHSLDTTVTELSRHGSTLITFVHLITVHCIAWIQIFCIMYCSALRSVRISLLVYWLEQTSSAIVVRLWRSCSVVRADEPQTNCLCATDMCV